MPRNGVHGTGCSFHLAVPHLPENFQSAASTPEAYRNYKSKSLTESDPQPGGYGNDESDGEQFSVGDHRSLEEVSAMIREKGFDPVCKDWDREFQMDSNN